MKTPVVRGFVYKDIYSVMVFYIEDVEIDPVALQEKLSRLLPEYMIPTNYVRLHEFPLLPSGKIDKQKLFPPEGNWNCFKDSNIPVLPLISQEGNHEVYGIGQDKAIKLFKESIPFAQVWQELVMMKEAYAGGRSAVNAYTIVRFGPNYGILTDRIKKPTLPR